MLVAMLLVVIVVVVVVVVVGMQHFGALLIRIFDFSTIAKSQ